MTKLYFRYGTVGSAKSLNLLAVAHKYRSQNKRILICKPLMDVRFGAEVVRSRAGLEARADILFAPGTVLQPEQLEGVSCLLVDEAQFLSRAIIDQLRWVADVCRVPVICYGLRTDFRSNLFEGAKRLMEVADEITEVKVTCLYCNRKATINMKLVDGQPTFEGPQVQLGCEETYVPVCHRHFREKTAPEIHLLNPASPAALALVNGAKSAKQAQSSTVEQQAGAPELLEDSGFSEEGEDSAEEGPPSSASSVSDSPDSGPRNQALSSRRSPTGKRSGLASGANGRRRLRLSDLELEAELDPLNLSRSSVEEEESLDEDDDRCGLGEGPRDLLLVAAGGSGFCNSGPEDACFSEAEEELVAFA